ncbi:hypothetical protein ACV33E_29895, partial [Pseudomonas aeruginosa]
PSATEGGRDDKWVDLDPYRYHLAEDREQQVGPEKLMVEFLHLGGTRVVCVGHMVLSRPFSILLGFFQSRHDLSNSTSIRRLLA